jgi:hypothetical protein
MTSSAGRIRGGYDERSHLAAEAAYQGRVGATRLEPVHVLLDDGRVRTVTVHVGVNIGSDPHLREAALDGALHRFEGGEELAVPYVLHDPTARRLALVVPAALRHRALEEHGKLIAAIAADREVPVPPYALEAKVVIGPPGLRAFLEAPVRPAEESLAAERDLLEAQRTALEMERGGLERERQDLLRQRETLERERAAAAADRDGLERDRAGLEQREQRVRERAESVTSREDELREEQEKQEAQGRDLGMREEELAQRLEALVQRERALRESEQRAREADLPPERPRSVPPERPRTLPPAAPPIGALLAPPASPIVQPAPSEEGPALDADEEFEELEPEPTAFVRVPAEDVEDAVEEIDDDDVAEEVEPDGEELGLPEESTGLSAVASDAAPTGPRLPDALADAELAAYAEDGVELLVRLPEGHDAPAELELSVRLSEEDGPVAILELSGRGPEGRMSRRAALDLRSSADRAVLDELRRRFEASVRCFAHDGRELGEARVASPLEVNAARVLDRGARLRSELPREQLAQRALSRPRPEEPHPFTAEPAGEGSAAAVLGTLEALAAWLAPDRIDRALTALAVPRDQIDLTVTRTLEAAIGHGLALPPSLAERALSGALVPDAAALVVRQIDAFRGTVLRPDRGRLDAEQIAANWERLVEAAASSEVPLDAETHDLAFRAIRAHRGEDAGGDDAVEPGRFDALDPPQLVLLLEHPRHRQAAAIALAARRDAAFADALCKAVRKMPRAEVVRVLPKLVGLGEEAGDALIDGLSARKTFVRQGFALVLGHLKLRRAVVPLLHRLLAEESEVGRELARVLGSFGNAAFRPFVRQLADARVDDARLVSTLAHLSLAGCDKQVAELTKDPDPRTRELAARAVASLADARAQEEIVRGVRPLESGDPVLAFSRRFEEELKGTAPEADLAGDE